MSPPNRYGTEHATHSFRWSPALFGREPHSEPAVRGLQEPPCDFWDRGVRAEAVDESAEDRQEDRRKDVGDKALVEVHAVPCQLVVAPPRRSTAEIGHVCVLGCGGSAFEPGRAGDQQERTRLGAARANHHRQAGCALTFTSSYEHERNNVTVMILFNLVC